MTDSTVVTTAQQQYVLYKAGRIKRAVKRGNKAAARKHALELQQVLGIGPHDLPIEDMLE